MLSNILVCAAIECPAQALGANQQTLLDGSTNLKVALIGGEQTIRCEPGFRVSKGWTLSQEACPTTFVATCGEEGQWDIPDECVPVECLSFPSNHDSLKCKDPACSALVKDSIVAQAIASRHASASGRFEYLDAVNITCNAGYHLFNQNDKRMQRSRSVCADDCLFTDVLSHCKRESIIDPCPCSPSARLHSCAPVHHSVVLEVARAGPEPAVVEPEPDTFVAQPRLRPAAFYPRWIPRPSASSTKTT